MALNIIKISRVSPSGDSADSLILPLTFFDLTWLNFLPTTQQVIFYTLLSSHSFYSIILPNLELSLSRVLRHYFPLAGHLTWDPQNPKPHIIVSPNDTVSLTVAESDADFSSVSGKGTRPAKEIRVLVPELPVFDDSPSLLALQLTLFPNQGFSIGITAHHAFVDAKTAEMFIKSWAHICKSQKPYLPQDLTPFLDRTVINSPPIIESKMLEFISSKYKTRSLKPPPIKEINEDVIRVTLELTQENVEKLKERVKNESTLSHQFHLSTFVVVSAYLWSCMVKTREGNEDRKVNFMYSADFRNRLNPPVPDTYLGNCVFPKICFGYEAKEFVGRGGFVNAVKMFSDSVKDLRSFGIEKHFEMFVEGVKRMRADKEVSAVSGSNRFSVYLSDFGWGRPVSSEIVSIDVGGILSMSKGRDERGGVEIGLCLKKTEMDLFIPLFKNGLEN